MKRSSNSAFTLIELLVVIAIIAILAAILFPVFAQAREKARQTTCLSNMKQVGLSILMYTQDYDETLPLLWAPNTANDPSGWGYSVAFRTYDWHNLVQPYTKSYQVFICPDSGRVKSDPTKYVDPFSSYGIPGLAAMGGYSNWIDLWYNGVAAAWDGVGGYYADSGYYYQPKVGTTSSPLAALAAPASMTLVSEGGEGSLWTDYMASLPYQYPTGTCTNFFIAPFYTNQVTLQGGPIAYHAINGSGSYSNYCWQWEPTFKSAIIVVGFADGHAKGMPVKTYFGTRITSAGQRVLQYLWPKE